MFVWVNVDRREFIRLARASHHISHDCHETQHWLSTFQPPATIELVMSQPPPPVIPPNMMPDQSPDMAANSYYPPEPSDLTGGLPINLDSLRDGAPGSKPFYPYSTLIRYAIKGSPNQKLLLEDIYYAIESRFPYFRTAPNGWKNSVRHNLSLNPCFEKVPRPLTDRGKGSYWTVNDTVDPRTGVHRIRKKKPKGSKQQRASVEGDVDYHPGEPSFDDPHAQFIAQPMEQEGGPNNRPGLPFPLPGGGFFAMQGPRFPPSAPLPMAADETIELDEHGNLNWRVAWLKELGHLQQVTAEQDKLQVDQEWYRMMLFRVRGALMAPINPAETVVHPPHNIPPPPPNGEQQ